MRTQLLLTLILADEVTTSRWQQFWDYFDYPGVEAWKFINLIVFGAAAVYILRRPLSDAFKGRRERIKQELRKAQEERDRALAELQEIEARLSRLDEEVAAIGQHAQAEAAAERERLTLETTRELAKLKESAQREIESAGKAAKQELREFAAQQSVRLAEETILREIRPDDDARLIGMGVERLGGSRN
jgi:F0F1-type ATP synthase membrane subunit b/b'